MPNEITQNSEYNHQTELYFVGMLFKNLLNKQFKAFKFYNVIEKMIEVNPEFRIKSFEEASNLISADILNEIDFTEEDRNVYKIFANSLTSHIIKYNGEIKFNNNIEEIIQGLAKVIIENALEEYILANNKLINCFINGGYTYKPDINIRLNYVKDFYELLNRKNQRNKKLFWIIFKTDY